jgi:predicted DsbA family dithiol-disulfide isomerase
MERLHVRVYYDFASTLSYVALRVMERMAGEIEALAIDLEWTPLDLTHITGWPRGTEVGGPRRENALRVARELEVAVRMPARWMDSRRAGAAALALAGTPHEPAWRERVFSAVYQEGRPVDEPGALESWARDLGLELEALVDDARLAVLEDETERARAAEVTGVPTFMLDGWPFGGIQQEFTMRQILSRWAARKRDQPRGTG